MEVLIFAAMGILVGVSVLLAIALLFKSFYRKVNQGEALIISKLSGDPLVTFNGGLVLPIVYRAEIMDISLKTIELSRRGKDGLICADNIRADITVTFFVRVNKTAEDVLKVAQAVGCRRASELDAVRDLFSAKFSEALKTVGKRLDFTDLYEKRDVFRDQIIEIIGQDLNGYVLEDAAIDYLEQTPIESLDNENILDTEGIRKIRELTTRQNTQTNELVNKERMEISRQNTQADEAIFRYDQQRAEALARTEKEKRIAQVREAEEAERFAIEQKKNTLLATQQAEEETERRNQEKQRNVETASLQRERVVAVETVEVEKARDLKEIERKREVELRNIAQEKEIEREKKDIAEVIRTRVAVDKTVAEEEERIKDTRVLSEARRLKDSAVIAAEGEAQAKLIDTVKQAEAMQEVAKFHAREKLVLAEADLEAADRTARAKVRLAEGAQAETAAPGLAEARVREALAEATEKEGLAQVRVRDAAAQVIEKEGSAEASVVRLKLVAEGEGLQQKGLADIHVRRAEAEVISDIGKAEAGAIRERALAEATGIAEKAVAMQKLDAVTRTHEEFRLRIQTAKELEMARIAVQKDLAQAQAEVLATTMASAKVQIVGGDGAFFDQFIKALSLGSAVDGLARQTEIGRSLLGGVLDGDGDVASSLRGALQAAGIAEEDAADMPMRTLVQRLSGKASGSLAGQLQAFSDRMTARDARSADDGQ
jgi:uncharacterized membrane protein YqiK